MPGSPVKQKIELRVRETHTLRNLTLPILNASSKSGRASNVALTTSGLSSAYNQTLEMIPSPKRDDNSSNRLDDGLVPTIADVVSRTKDMDVAIASLRSTGVSGLCRWDIAARRDF